MKLAAPALGAALIAASMLAPGAAYAVAQRPTLAQDPGACAFSTHWHAVMPNGVRVTMACPGVPQEPVISGHAAALRGARAQLREPLYVAPIRTAEARPAGRSLMVAGPQYCRPGAYWMMHVTTKAHTSIPLACR